MEYVAFLFLGLGVLLVLAGVLLQARDTRSGKLVGLDSYMSQPKATENPLAVNLKPLKTSVPESFAPPAAAPQMSEPMVAPAHHAIPGPFQFVQPEPPKPVAPAAPAVAVSVGQKNPRLFEKFAYLYLDSSQRNVYDGAGSIAAFDLSEVNGIRRFGRGVFSYDGFGFYFDHNSGQERFPLANLKTVGFYPNCVALTFRTAQPVALLFMEETESIRKVLETFRLESAS